MNEVPNTDPEPKSCSIRIQFVSGSTTLIESCSRVSLPYELHGGSAGGLPEALQRLDQPGDGGGLRACHHQVGEAVKKRERK